MESTKKTRYLYRYKSGKWYIGPNLGSHLANIISMTKSVSPFTDGLEWKYWDGSAWNVDKSLKVSRGEIDSYSPIHDKTMK